MAESQSHKRSKSKAAGKTGQTEVRLKGGRRLDAQTKTKAIEIERSGNRAALTKAASRLKVSHKSRKVLQVPQRDMAKAVEAMKKIGVKGTVKNISGTKRRSVS
jgi:hypothetical protein